MTPPTTAAEDALETLCEYAFTGYGPRTTSRSTPQDVQKAIETIREALQAAQKSQEIELELKAYKEARRDNGPA